MSRRKQKQSERKRWEPLEQWSISAAYVASAYPNGIPDGVRLEVWASDLYQCVVEHWPDGMAYITIKRQDRRAIRDWRHLQSIKNEAVGPEREAFELFPAESRLVDEANQYHLWVLPEGERLGVGSAERHVGDVEFTQGRVRGEHRGRQRPWQPGLQTGGADEQA